ncbi:PsbP-related protein [Methylophilus sp. Leaf414]|uniref:PsbP-related protein n=1 Tax=Methylophilus sp. Leaf414 TaxID=1736371 RepID=UPI0006FC5098|nr:PsbP-related protein [Methylophilus sp. Leaf414]KQT38167.1 hypothetical protein ASG24_04195 [Methylophilus sp. Leaf414]
MHFYKKIIIFSLITLLTSCGGPFTRLTKAEYVDTNKNFKVSLPVGWVQINGYQSENALWISKDGYSLQSIRIEALKPDKAFSRIKKPAAANMPISDLAELELAEIKAKSSNAASIKVLENTLENVSDQKAFRLHIQYLNEKGLRFEQVTYGLVSAQNYYRISYQAPSIHYFERDKQTFNQTVTSFKITG